MTWDQRDQPLGIQKRPGLVDLVRRAPEEFVKNTEMGVAPHQGTEPCRRLAVLANRRVQLADGHERINKSQALQSFIHRWG